MALNPQQRAAVEHSDTPLLVLAGAGSGKTGVIIEKIAHLVTIKGYDPKSIIAVTFTNKAAQEMRERLRKKLDAPTVKKLSISTFHRLGLTMLRGHKVEAGLRAGFTILDQSDAAAALKEIINEHKSTLEERDVQNRISQWKNGFISADQALREAVDGKDQTIAKLYAIYDQWLRACNSVDFDDLIKLPVEILQSHPDIHRSWNERVRHLLIDEYQDTNAAQYALVQLLVDKFGSLTAVGDDDQSIYSWRGARPDNLISLKNDYPNLEVIKLEQNYRSSQRILRCANAVISKNPHIFEKKLWSHLGLGDELRVSTCRHAPDEADWVAGQILTRHFQLGTKFGDFAILYRSNFQSRLFEQALREKSIAYSITGGKSFFDYTEIKDLLAYLKLLVNTDDDTAFLRCINTPRRDIGPDTLTKLGLHARHCKLSLFDACLDQALPEHLSNRAVKNVQRFAHFMVLAADNAKRGDLMKVITGLIDDIDYRDWMDNQADGDKQRERMHLNVDELLSWIRRLTSDDENQERSLEDIVGQLSLHDMLSHQEEEQREDQVQLMTLHAAKGLEFPHVFLVGMEEDILPHRNSQDDTALEEERRLAYVGMTRAKSTLTMTRARTRQNRGDINACEPSRFIDDLPTEDVIFLGGENAEAGESRRNAGREALANIRAMLTQD
ncbi:MAG: UvrD-helicase domain-containing protein [Gammaproteobacteria bacterium]|nr:UvrD-helicase domain-containing protein [Gammaproteobacteria bacterium]